MAFLPERSALELTHRFSLPLLLFHDVTVAPYSITSTESPLGSDAVTFLPSECTVGWGPDALGESAEGLFALSTIVAVRCMIELLKQRKGQSLSWMLLVLVAWWGGWNETHASQLRTLANALISCIA